MKEYMHNNKTIKYQEVVDQSFLAILAENGVRPRELPVPDFRYRVFAYNTNGNHKYAAVIVANAPDAYIEKVFIMDSIPEDGFWSMMQDVSSQNSGAEPEKIKSRLSTAIKEAENSAYEFIQNKYRDQAAGWMLMGYPAEIQDEIREMQKLYLNQYGYHLWVLDHIDVNDVDLEYVKNILG